LVFQASKAILDTHIRALKRDWSFEDNLSSVF